MNDMPLLNLPRWLRATLAILLGFMAAALTAKVWTGTQNNVDDADRLLTMLAVMQIVLTGLLAVLLSGVSRSGGTAKSLLARADRFLEQELPEVLADMHFHPARIGDFKSRPREVIVEVAHYPGDVRADIIVTAAGGDPGERAVLLDVNVKVDTVTLVVKVPAADTESCVPGPLNNWVAHRTEGFTARGASGSGHEARATFEGLESVAKYVAQDPKVSGACAIHIPLAQTYGMDFLVNPAERLRCAQQIAASVRDLMVLEVQTGVHLTWNRSDITLH